MTFGEKITVLRKQLKWSQDDLAKKIGTSAPIVGRYEREEITPSIDVAAKIADALNVTVDYLIGHSDNMIMDKNLVRRMEDIEALPNEEKDKVCTLLIWLWLTIKRKKLSLIKSKPGNLPSFYFGAGTITCTKLSRQRDNYSIKLKLSPAFSNPQT